MPLASSRSAKEYRERVVAAEKEREEKTNKRRRRTSLPSKNVKSTITMNDEKAKKRRYSLSRQNSASSLKNEENMKPNLARQGPTPYVDVRIFIHGYRAFSSPNIALLHMT